MVFATLLYDDAAGAEKEDLLSYSLATSDTVLQKTVRYLLAQSGGVELDSDDGPVFVIDALVEQPTKRDAVLLSPGLADGSRVRVCTAEQRAALPNSIGVALLRPLPDHLAPPRTSFLATHINALARADSSLVPRLQVTVHLLTLHDVDPRTECFTAVLNLMIDWVDEQLAGKEKDEIDDIVGNPDLYVRPAVSIGNMVGGDEALAGATPRCDNSRTGNIKLTAKITGTFASPMDMHRFPFDTQTLHFETIVRSITLDKKHLINEQHRRASALGGPGQGQAPGHAPKQLPPRNESRIIRKTNNARLLIEVVDAAHPLPVRAGRKHQIKENADKVHEWSFSTSRTAMDGLETAEWRALKAQYAERQVEQGRAHTDAAHRAALAGCIDVLKRLAKVCPLPQMQHSPLLSEESKHVVLFEIAREVGATMWTLTLPVFLVTFISFSQFYVPENALADRLSVSLTTILTIIAFQVVVRDKVPAVPYRTLMDDYMLVGLGVMTLQVIGSVIAKSMIGAGAVAGAVATRKVSDTAAGGAAAANNVADLPLAHAALSRAPFSDVDDAFLLLCSAWWLGSLLTMARRIFDWRAELAWFDKGVQEALEVCAKQMYQYEDRGRKASLVRAASEKHLKATTVEAAPPLRGTSEQEQEHTAVRKRHGQVAPLRPDDGSSSSSSSSSSTHSA